MQENGTRPGRKPGKFPWLRPVLTDGGGVGDRIEVQIVAARPQGMPGSATESGMEKWTTGYSASELTAAQERYGLVFPPDLIELLREKQPIDGYDWRRENPAIRARLRWPFEMLQFDLEENGLWWPEWGDRPKRKADRSAVLAAELAKAPKLIPLIAHRFIPELPHEAGNPVFSMHGMDTIYYGANLAEYFDNEFNGKWVIGPTKRIEFWSDLVDRNR